MITAKQHDGGLVNWIKHTFSFSRLLITKWITENMKAELINR